MYEWWNGIKQKENKGTSVFYVWRVGVGRCNVGHASCT
jgi:hypothetical protein